MPFARLWATLVGLGALGLGCGEDKPLPPPPPRERSNVVVVSSSSASSRATSAPSTAASTAPKAPRKLCTESTAGREPPKAPVRVAQAAGASPPPATIAFGAGKWIWVNLWAAWCVPCKEEMPRLRRWHAELRKAGVLIDFAYVSLDDDERQLQRFLDAEPKDGLRASYWLPEEGRSAWLRSLGVSENAQLPVQILVSPRGEVSCVIDGAVEEQDYAALRAHLGR